MSWRQQLGIPEHLDTFPGTPAARSARMIADWSASLYANAWSCDSKQETIGASRDQPRSWNKSLQLRGICEVSSHIWISDTTTIGQNRLYIIPIIYIYNYIYTCPFMCLKVDGTRIKVVVPGVKIVVAHGFSGPLYSPHSPFPPPPRWIRPRIKSGSEDPRSEKPGTWAPYSYILHRFNAV